MNDLITKCVVKEEKLKRENNESAHLVALGKSNNQKRVEKARKPKFHSHKKSKNFKIEVVSIMGSMVMLDNKRDLLQGTYRIMVLLLNILCLVVLNRMVWQKGVTTLLWK